VPFIQRSFVTHRRVALHSAKSRPWHGGQVQYDTIPRPYRTSVHRHRRPAMTVHGARSPCRAGAEPANRALHGIDALSWHSVTSRLCFNLIGFYKVSNAWMNLAIMVGPAAGQGLPMNFRRLGRFGGTHGATARIKYSATCHTSQFSCQLRA
jgi:hypothetical protein